MTHLIEELDKGKLDDYFDTSFMSVRVELRTKMGRNGCFSVTLGP